MDAEDPLGCSKLFSLCFKFSKSRFSVWEDFLSLTSVMAINRFELGYDKADDAQRDLEPPSPP